MLPVRPIPSTGETLPVYGMGSWKTFDAAPGPDRNRLSPVLEAFFAAGGRVVDTSPMYGRAEEALGELLPPPGAATAFVAGKVWVKGRAEGIAASYSPTRR